MKIHYLQHVPFEDVAYMGNWAKENGIHFSPIRLYEDDPYPPLSDVDALAESLNTIMVKLMNCIILGRLIVPA